MAISKPYRVGEIYESCQQFSPFISQEAWDNSGLNVGSMDFQCERILVCLEITHSIALALEPKTLIITHHPLFFRPIKDFIYESYPANLAQILIQKECCVISLHTNFDKSHLNAYLTHKILGFSHFIADANALMMHGNIEPLPLPDLAMMIKHRLNAPFVNYVQGDMQCADKNQSSLISYVYVVCGSGCSLMSEIPLKLNACLITADVKHHDAMIAKSMGISLIDMGHYESEKYFVQIIDSLLQNAGYNAIIADCKNPFYFC